MSISQIRALGDRLRGKGTPRAGDLELLQRLRSDYDAPLQFAEKAIRQLLRVAATSRLKTVQTLIEKLTREKTRLSVMQDIAGLRIVEDITLQQQDDLVQRVAAAFERATVDDRRARPSFGYRAVHVIVEVEDCLVEVQVRTRLQDLWAQAMESLADRWGRQIRYGLPPTGDLEAKGESDVSAPTRSDMVDLLLSISEGIAKVEDLDSTHEPERIERMTSELRSLLARFARFTEHL